jgi:hypothetical protein
MRPVNMRLGARSVRSHAAFIVAAMVAGVALHSVALAQPAVTKPPAREPTLDELLGIKPAAPAKPEAQPGAEPAADGAKPSADPSREALDRDLSDAEVDEAFAQAVALMGQTAARLGGADGKSARDAGLETQRLQEDILRKLDALIDAAEKNAQQSQSKSKQKSQQQQQQDQQQQGQQSSQAQAQQQQQGQRAGTQAGEGMPGQAAQPGTALGGSAANWGNLPQHVRDALTEGTSDRFSSMYRAMTEEYYKRLAEDRGGTSPRERRP